MRLRIGKNDLAPTGVCVPTFVKYLKFTYKYGRVCGLKTVINASQNGAISRCLIERIAKRQPGRGDSIFRNTDLPFYTLNGTRKIKPDPFRNLQCRNEKNRNTIGQKKEEMSGENRTSG